MADENPSCDHNIEYHLIAMFEKLEAMRTETLTAISNDKTPMQVEIRTLEFWRSVISECLASFIYVFVVCGAAAGTAGSGVNVPISSIFLATALASGFAMTSLTQCFGHISGAHVNPSVSVAMGIIKRISLLRTVFFVLAQCGGAIAGAAFLYGVTVPVYPGNLSAVISNSPNVAPWEKFGIEFILTLIVVFSYFVSMDTYRKWIGTSSLTIGATYSACSFVAMSHLNPARSLGPSFVLNKYDNHWVYWIGPILGGIAAALIYEYIFNPRRQKRSKVTQDDESTSIHSDEMDNYDDLDKQMPPKFHGSNYNTYRASGGGSNYCTSLYSAPASKLERGESIYGGTKSLYCNSPPLTRANLNRSQSVYAKSNTFINKDILPKTGPLVPTQSMYPIRINQQSHVLNQNVQNFLQQKNEGIYGVRGITPGTSNRPDTHGGNDHPRDNYSTGERNYSTAERARRDRDRENNSSGDKPYGTRGNLGNGDGSSKFEDNPKPNRGSRPESMYGRLNTQQRHIPSAQSDDSSYSSYTATSTSRNGFNAAASSFHCPQKPPSRPSQNSQMMSTASGSGPYHHSSSPNPQY